MRFLPALRARFRAIFPPTITKAQKKPLLSILTFLEAEISLLRFRTMVMQTKSEFFRGLSAFQTKPEFRLLQQMTAITLIKTMQKCRMYLFA